MVPHHLFDGLPAAPESLTDLTVRLAWPLGVDLRRDMPLGYCLMAGRLYPRRACAPRLWDGSSVSLLLGMEDAMPRRT